MTFSLHQLLSLTSLCCSILLLNVQVHCQVDRDQAVRIDRSGIWENNPSSERGRHGRDINARNPPAELQRPPMGWNSWNAFACNLTDINEEKMKSTIDILVTSGLAEAGYRYFNLDDCWLDPAMTGGTPISKKMNLTSLIKAPRAGPLRADPKRFTNGSLATLSDYAHANNLMFGTYLDAGLATCQGFGGSNGYEEDDATVLAEWKVDYLKLDGCRMDDMDAAAIYTKWSESLRRTERDFVFSCSYPAYAQEVDHKFPEEFDWNKIQEICNLWRLYSDVSAHWDSLVSIMEYWAVHGEILRKYHGANGYNDPDMLEIGNEGVTLAEGRTQMSIWAILAAPLILGNDLTQMNEDHLAILTNQEVLAVNQDRLVVQGRRIVNATDHSIWIRELSDRSVAIAIVNLLDSSRNVGFCWDDIVNEMENISSSSLLNEGCDLQVRDLWSRVDMGQDGVIDPENSPCIKSTSRISPHGTFFIRVAFSSNCFEEDWIEEEQSVWKVSNM